MPHESKKQSEQHLIDAEGQQLLRARLPRHWVLREYRPDYGLDFALEIFSDPEEVSTRLRTYETLGEHIFIQLKSTKSTESKSLKLFSRDNVEKQRERLNKSDVVAEIETIRYPLERSELVTVERMGVAVPVLLVIADLSKQKCFFVCLNDYIDKILVPRHENYKSTGSRRIHVPIDNEVGEIEPGQVALRWYAKRAKLYAAFQRFIFQEAELRYAFGTPAGMRMANYFASRIGGYNYFASRIGGYDFWDDIEMCAIIEYYGQVIRRFEVGGDLGLMRVDEDELHRTSNGDTNRAQEITASIREQEVFELWRRLAVLPRNYEDVWREWFLPTSLGFACSYG